MSENSLTRRAKRHPILASEIAKQNHILYLSCDYEHDSKQKIATDKKLEYEYFINVAAYKGHFSITRLKAHWQFALGVFNMMVQKKPKMIILSSIPPEVPFVAVIYKLLFNSKLKICMDVRDIWPDAILKNRSLNTITKVLIKSYFNVINFIIPKNVDKTIVTNPDFFKSKLVNKDAKVIHLGYEQARWPKIDKDQIRTGCVYIGNLNSQFDLRIFQENLFTNLGGLEIIGVGPLLNKYKSHFKQSKFSGFVAPDEVPGKLQNREYGVLPITGAATFPNKLYDYFASGLSLISNSREVLESLMTENGEIYCLDQDVFLLLHADIKSSLFLDYEETTKKIMAHFFD